MNLLKKIFRDPEPSYPSPVSCKPNKPEYAIPLTVAEAGRLADSLALVDRLSYEHKKGTPGGGFTWARNLANEIAGYVGGAKIRGYVYVPIPESHMQYVDMALECGLELNPQQVDLATFETLVRRMHVLRGMARPGGWLLNPAAHGAAWMNGEPDREALEHGEGDDLPVIV